MNDKKYYKVKIRVNIGESIEKTKYIYISANTDFLDTYEEARRLLLENDEFLAVHGEINILGYQIMRKNIENYVFWEF